MDGFGIELGTRSGTVRYVVTDGGERVESWDNAQIAESHAHRLLMERKPRYVTIGDGRNEFRMWHPDWDPSENLNFGNNGRWGTWYVDARINGRRWRFAPVANIDDLETAEENALRLREVPDVDLVWVGASDGSEEYEYETREGLTN